MPSTIWRRWARIASTMPDNRPSCTLRTAPRIEGRTQDFGGTAAVVGERHHVVLAPSPIVVARVDRAGDALVDLGIVGDAAAALARGDVLVVVEAVRACIANGAEHAALVSATDARARVFDDQEVVLLRDLPDRVHVAGAAPKVDRDHGSRSGSDRVLDGVWVDGQRFVDVDDHRDYAHREH